MNRFPQFFETIPRGIPYLGQEQGNRRTGMLRVFIVVASLLIAALPARAQDAEAIRGVIAEQLEAFNDRDAVTAFTFASPAIKGLFGNATNFGMMVQNGYPMVWDNRDVQFKELEDVGGQLVQRLTLRDADGVRYALDYYMIETAEGWQINGVSVVPMPDVGA
jgi:hypothetical protein